MALIVRPAPAPTLPVPAFRIAEAAPPPPSPIVISPEAVTAFAPALRVPLFTFKVVVATLAVLTEIVPPETATAPKGPAPDQLPVPLKVSKPPAV